MKIGEISILQINDGYASFNHLFAWKTTQACKEGIGLSGFQILQKFVLPHPGFRPSQVLGTSTYMTPLKEARVGKYSFVTRVF